ncbi:MAG TPA: hypothetical protein VFR42_04695 [Candidatus Acidoferrum sp.]|nr:hypothetical protein [Candidatus Acidoferrum sp.]
MSSIRDAAKSNADPVNNTWQKTHDYQLIYDTARNRGYPCRPSDRWLAADSDEHGNREPRPGAGVYRFGESDSVSLP